MSLSKLNVSAVANEFTQQGRYFRVLQSVAPVEIVFYFAGGDSYRTQLKNGLGVEFNAPSFNEPFTKYEITSEVNQVIEVFAGLAKMEDNRTTGIEVSQQGVSELINRADSLTSTPKEIAQANANRRRLTIQTDAKIYIGGENVSAAEGLTVDAGGMAEVEARGGVWALADSTANIRLMEELN